MIKKPVQKPLYLYSFSVPVILALLLVFAGTAYGSYRIRNAVTGGDVGSVLSEREESEDVEDNEDNNSGHEGDESESEDVENENEERGNSSSNKIQSRGLEDEMETEDEIEIENEVEDETENESGIGSENELKKFTHEQEKLQEQVKEQLEKLSERKGVVKTLVGPNYEALLQMQRAMEQNTLMLQQLEQLKTQAATPEETQLVESLTNTLQNQNQVLNQRIEKEQETFSIFGWLSKLFLK